MPPVTLSKDGFRNAAVLLYGSGHSNEGYIDMLAKSLRKSHGGVAKTWYGRRRVGGPATTALILMIRISFTEMKGVADDDILAHLERGFAALPSGAGPEPR